MDKFKPFLGTEGLEAFKQIQIFLRWILKLSCNPDTLSGATQIWNEPGSTAFVP
jgi:hypothetical protein